MPVPQHMQARTVMIANISPTSVSVEHTLNTLRYADRVKGDALTFLMDMALKWPAPLMFFLHHSCVLCKVHTFGTYYHSAL